MVGVKMRSYHLQYLCIESRLTECIWMNSIGGQELEPQWRDDVPVREKGTILVLKVAIQRIPYSIIRYVIYSTESSAWFNKENLTRDSC